MAKLLPFKFPGDGPHGCECRAQDKEDGPNLEVEASVHSLLILRKVSVVWVNLASSLCLLE